MSEGLVLSDICVTYGSVQAVRGASLTIAPGTVTAVLGPSGSGKSSLLRAVAGLETPTGGRICVNGEDMTGRPAHARGFGMMFQSGALFPHLSVAGNVAYGLQRGPGRLARRERAERVRELLELVGLADYADRSPQTLSGGQAQRVALARSLAPRPAVLLLDEPLSALDRSLREHLATQLRRIMTDAGVAGLYVTHDQDEAFTVADRLAILMDGVVRREGPTREVWVDPREAEIAEFLGYRPFVPHATARRWGLLGEGDLLALSPGSLTLPARAGDVRVDVRVTGWRDVRGARHVSSELAGIGEAVVWAPLGYAVEPGPLTVGLDPQRTAWVSH